MAKNADTLVVMTWNPSQYLKFQQEREQPGLDLLAALPGEFAPKSMVDLGCGAGNLTQRLVQKFPAASLLAVDSSAEMLEKAASFLPRETLVQADLNHWQPPAPVDLIFSNATLHWLQNHPALLHRWVGALNPGGVLAVQMPYNIHAPSHQAVARVAGEAPWAEKLKDRLTLFDLPLPQDYHLALSAAASQSRLWLTTYCHVLPSAGAVLEWLKGTTLTHFLNALEDGEKDGFLRRVGEALRAVHPPLPSGEVWFPFTRLFLLAKK